MIFMLFRQDTLFWILDVVSRKYYVSVFITFSAVDEINYLFLVVYFVWVCFRITGEMVSILEVFYVCLLLG